jgi:mannosylglycoprotein endo-beta-mannosidase
VNEFAFRLKLREHSYKLSLIREQKWQQRSSIIWLKLGDNNTRYFHTVAFGRLKRNQVNILQTDDRTINENNEIALAFSHFFKSLIGKRGNTENLPPDLIIRENGIELQQLALPFTNEEIRNVVSALAKGKSSGPDGFPAEFFQTY